MPFLQLLLSPLLLASVSQGLQLSWNATTQLPSQSFGQLRHDSTPDIGSQRGLCPPDHFAGAAAAALFGGASPSDTLPPCTSASEASQGGVWLHTSAFNKSLLDQYGIYNRWCFRPLSCSLKPISHAAAAQCMAGKHMLTMGDSNGGYFATSVAKFLRAGMNAVTTLNVCDETNGWPALPAAKTVLQGCVPNFQRITFPVTGTNGANLSASFTVERLPLYLLGDTRIRSRHGGTLASLSTLYWCQAVPLPDFVVANVGTHEAKLQYALAPDHSLASMVHEFDEASGMASYPIKLREFMRFVNSLATKAGVWLHSAAIKKHLQPDEFASTTSNRRLMVMNSWATSIAAFLPRPMDVVHSTVLSAQEFPELHSDGVHMRANGGVYYHALRDIVLSTLCNA